MMDDLSQLLFVISNVLLIPVVIGLLILAAWSLMNLGGVVFEAVQRRRRRPSFSNLIQRLKSEPDCRIALDDVPREICFVREALRFPIKSHEKMIDDFQLDCEHAISRLQIGVRLGPVLGLVGTLIPLGPALLALSSGNIELLSQQLIVAFATTVLGLTVGGITYTIATVRRTWYNRDLSDISYLYVRMTK